MIVALSAVLIGVCALGVSLVQVRIMRAEQHATVWPRLVVAGSYSEGSRIAVLVANPGIGPAVIRSVSATVDGEPAGSWTEIFDRLVGEDRAWRTSAAFIRGRVIPAGDVVRTVEIVDSVYADRIQREIHRVELEVCYCSVYDRCWIASLQSAGEDPHEVPACGPPRAPFSG